MAMSASYQACDPPVMPYWHVWCDDEGISHQSQGVVSGFAMQVFSAGAAPLWVQPGQQGQLKILFLQLPPGWQGDWHENPAPQWIIPLQGCWAVETMDGHTVEMGPGMLSFGGGQNTRSLNGRRGHRSWTVGDQAAVLMLVQLSADMDQPAIPR
jgi:hypothetical protein